MITLVVGGSTQMILNEYYTSDADFTYIYPELEDVENVIENDFNIPAITVALDHKDQLATINNILKEYKESIGEFKIITRSKFIFDYFRLLIKKQIISTLCLEIKEFFNGRWRVSLVDSDGRMENFPVCWDLEEALLANLL